MVGAAVTIKVQKPARQDLRALTLYGLENFGLAVSREYRAGLEALFARLHAHPAIGTLAYPDLGIRSFRYRKHRVFYRVDGDTLVILRVLSPRQTPPDQL